MPIPINFQDASGAPYRFDLYVWGEALPGKGGVYAVLKEEGGRYRIIYIGQTQSLSDRLADHDKNPYFIRHGRTHIGVHPSEDALARSRIEKELIDMYSPPCNASGTPGHERAGPFHSRA